MSYLLEEVIRRMLPSKLWLVSDIPVSRMTKPRGWIDAVTLWFMLLTLTAWSLFVAFFLHYVASPAVYWETSSSLWVLLLLRRIIAARLSGRECMPS